MPEENTDCSFSKNVKINRKTRCLLSFANSVSSHDNEFVVQSNFRRKDICVLDKFIKRCTLLQQPNLNSYTCVSVRR